MSTPLLQDSGDTEPNRWYLAYGSNLSSETFQGRRGIRPLAQANVIVPSLELTFDLPGLPYWEPCFANVNVRSTDFSSMHATRALIGIAYLITPEDYAKVIATEGGGASYKEYAVECRRLPESTDRKDGDQAVNVQAAAAMQGKGDPGEQLIAYTLLAPDSKRRSTPLQPSKRYINILQAGARENKLPPSYIAYLDSIPYYRKTSVRQRIGGPLFLAVWLPPLLLIIVLQKIFADRKTGRLPGWLVTLAEAGTSAMWRNYERVWKGIFGSGEVTESHGSSPIESQTYTEKRAFDGLQTEAPPAHIDFYNL